MPDARRLFFALWPSAPLRAAIAAQAATMTTRFSCRPMASDNLHVTLAFVGAVPQARVAELVKIGQSIASSAGAIAFDRLAVWRPARVLVLVATCTPEPLVQCVRVLQTQLAGAGFQTDARPFRPHITLARDVRAVDMECEVPALIWPLEGFVLVQSVPSRDGVHYQVLARFSE